MEYKQKPLFLLSIKCRASCTGEMAIILLFPKIRREFV